MTCRASFRLLQLAICATAGCRDPIVANPAGQGPSNNFAQCVKETGATQLESDKSTELNAQVSHAVASGAAGATLKDALIQRFQPVGDTCNQARIIELCYALASSTTPAPFTCNNDSSQADPTSLLREALQKNAYDIGWSNAPVGTPDSGSGTYAIADVHFLNDSIVSFRCTRPTSNEFRATLRGRRLVGTWTDVDGRGEFELLFDEGFARGEGWWNLGGQTQKYNLFVRRHY